MTTFNQETNKLNPDIYLELFDFDATLIGTPSDIWYLTNTPTGGGASPILWRSNNYFPLPFELSGAEVKGDGTSPPRPHISVSNVNQFFFAAILTLGNLKGMRVTRWRTFFRFTDNGSEPNPIMHAPTEMWIVTRKVAQSKNAVEFEMSDFLDRPGLKLPRKQILRDKGFPGVGRIRRR